MEGIPELLHGTAAKNPTTKPVDKYHDKQEELASGFTDTTSLILTPVGLVSVFQMKG